MSQETRKDTRAKIVSLNVKYKSATVDEFIENHSHDVSKGGVFIKTATPFAPGTLLKFEIRIAGDQSVIGGVGRVVWKREGSQASADSPGGMGVKFIKLDDASRANIDRLVGGRDDAGSAFEAGMANAPKALGNENPTMPPPPVTGGAPTLAPTPAAAAARKATMIGVGVGKTGSASTPGPAHPPTAATPVAPVARAKPVVASPTGAAPAPTPAPTPAPKPVVAAAPPPVAPKEEPKPAGVSPSFFPKTDSAKEMPPQNERTMMRQASELLEEALKGAGGSLDELGQDPLFEEGKPPVIGSAAEPPKAEPAPAAKADTASDEPATKAAAPEPVAEEAAAKSTPPPAKEPAPPADKPAPREPVAAAVAPPPPSKNGWVVPVVVAGAAILGFVAYTQMNTPPPPVAPIPPPIPSASAAASTAPSASAAPSGAPSSATSAAASGAPSASASGAPSGSASALPAGGSSASAPATTAAAPVVPAPPPPRRPRPPRPAPTPTDDNTPPPATATPGDTPPPATPKPTAAPTPEAKPTAAPPVAPPDELK